MKPTINATSLLVILVSVSLNSVVLQNSFAAEQKITIELLGNYAGKSLRVEADTKVVHEGVLNLLPEGLSHKFTASTDGKAVNLKIMLDGKKRFNKRVNISGKKRVVIVFSSDRLEVFAENK